MRTRTSSCSTQPHSSRLRIFVAAAVVALAIGIGGFVGVGCASDDESSAGGTQSTTAAMTGDTSTTSSTIPAASTTTFGETTTSLLTTTTGGTTATGALSSAETVLPNGNIRAMGFIDQIRYDGTTNHIRIDYAEMLAGEEAIAAAVEAGYIEPGETLPNDYFISNINPQRREFSVSDGVAITTSTWGGVMERPVTWEEFRSFWSADPPPDTTHLRNVPWWIERQGDVVVKIDEQYLP